jgi:hypothetical protein
MMLKYIGCIFFVIAYIISVSAKEIPELTNPVIDQAGILSEQFKFHLNNKLKGIIILKQLKNLII